MIYIRTDGVVEGNRTSRRLISTTRWRHRAGPAHGSWAVTDTREVCRGGMVTPFDLEMTKSDSRAEIRVGDRLPLGVESPFCKGRLCVGYRPLDGISSR